MTVNFRKHLTEGSLLEERVTRGGRVGCPRESIARLALSLFILNEIALGMTNKRDSKIKRCKQSDCLLRIVFGNLHYASKHCGLLMGVA